MRRKTTVLGIIAVLVLLGIIQLVPYGRTHTNPPVTAEPAWDKQQTREIAVRACYDCHSNETRWNWHSNVAPISWLIHSDVDRGRGELNFSEWDRPQEEPGEAAKTVRQGEMPQWYYIIMHPEANLTPQAKQAFILGLEATFGTGEERSDRD